MTDFPGFPSNNFDFNFETLGPVMAGLVVRDRNGVPRAGLLPSREDLVRRRADWFLDFSPFVAVRVKGRSVLIGGSDENGQVEIAPAPSANARIDVVWTRPADLDLAEEIVSLEVATGVPAAVPSKPPIPEGAIEIGTLRVPAGATSTNGATWTATFLFTAAAGGVLYFRNTAERTDFQPCPGQIGVVGATLWHCVGTAWVRSAPDLPQEYKGTVSQRSVPANNSVTVEVPWPTGTFDGTPFVNVTAWGSTGKFSASVAGIGVSGCTVRLNNFESVARNIGAQIQASR